MKNGEPLFKDDNTPNYEEIIIHEDSILESAIEQYY